MNDFSKLLLLMVTSLVLCIIFIYSISQIWYDKNIVYYIVLVSGLCVISYIYGIAQRHMLKKDGFESGFVIFLFCLYACRGNLFLGLTAMLLSGLSFSFGCGLLQDRLKKK